MRTADAYAYLIDASPGNGTRYRLVIVIDSDGVIHCVAWPDFEWAVGDFGQSPPSAEWMSRHGVNRADAEAIAVLVADLHAEVTS